MLVAWTEVQGYFNDIMSSLVFSGEPLSFPPYGLQRAKRRQSHEELLQDYTLNVRSHPGSRSSLSPTSWSKDPGPSLGCLRGCKLLFTAMVMGCLDGLHVVHASTAGNQRLE